MMSIEKVFALIQRYIQQTKKELWVLFLLYVVIDVTFGWYTSSMSSDITIVDILYVLFSSFLSFLIVVVLDRQVRNEQISLQDSILFTFKRYPFAFIGTAVYFMLIFAGILFFIVPGIFIGVVFSQVTFYLLLLRESFKKAFSKSYTLTKGKRWQLLGYLVPLYIALFAIAFIDMKSSVFHLLGYFMASLLAQILYFYITYALWHLLRKESV